jgi:quercetin dioxygenase-like cupin family protein
MTSFTRRLVTVSLAAALVTVAPSTAWADTAPAVSGTVLAKGTSTGTIATDNRGPTDVVVRRIVIPPGGTTGWHYHLGELVAVVLSGTLTRQLDDCSIRTSPAGQAFVEAAGRNHVHIGRNLGAEPVELYVTYLIPAGAPLSIERPDPGC